MRFLLSVLISITPLLCHGADVKFPVRDIPEELKQGVNVVVRDDRMTYTIHTRSSATLHSYFAVTIFNGQGKRYAQRTVGYDKLSKVKNIKANIYDADGKLIKKIKPAEILDFSSYDGSLFSDNRYKKIDMSQGNYPYTIEFEYELEYKFLYAIDGTNLISGEKASVQHVSYELIFPSELAPRYKVLNMEAEPKKSTTEKGLQSLYWSFTNLKPITLEPSGPSADQVMPRIIAAPSAFEYEGYAGDMSTWENYGKWESILMTGRDKLPETTKAKVRELTKNLQTTEQKAKVLYEYLQSKTRYVSIQLGIGGLQPFEASLVDQTGYGDCKALSNYMVALLREAGIKGHYTTVMAGDFQYDVMLDFPSHQGNHVVVSVPNGADTLWLECTSQTNPFGYSGMFTGDRKAFMLTDDGGVWVNTPKYNAALNTQSRVADVFVANTGEATAKIKTIYSGLQYENDNLNHILNEGFDEQKKWVLNAIDIPSFDVKTFKIENKKGKVPSATVTLDLSLRHFATVNGKRLMMLSNLMNRNTYVPEKVENRKSNVIRNFEFTDYDTIRYHIPEDIYPEYLPDAVKLKTRFGEYEVSYKLEQGLVVYTRKLIMYKGSYPANSYQELIDFYKNVTRSDNTKLVFLNKT